AGPVAGHSIRRRADARPGPAPPWRAGVSVGPGRPARRSYAAAPEIRDGRAGRQTVRWQAAALRDAEPILREYLHGIGEDLARVLPRCSARQQADILAVIAELHADAGPTLCALLDDRSFTRRAEAIACL